MKPGDLFAGRYTLVRQIGVGGFSVVWQATDSMSEDSVIAIKVYAPERGMDEFGLKQFRREYANMLNMSHENLVTARHFDIWQGRPFLIMPYMESGSLYGKLMNLGTLSEMEIATVGAQLARGLNYLHERNILHQDIKPENVLLDDMGRYYLTDFGISSRLRHTMKKATQAEAKSLTVSYAPPERFSGSQQPTKGGDIFSLGILFYELATGNVPWMGAGGVVVREDSPPLKLPEHYSPELENLINACISYHPEKRVHASDILQACESYLKTGQWLVIKNQAGSAKSPQKKNTTGRATVKMPPPTHQEENTLPSGQSGKTVAIKSNKHLRVTAAFIASFIVVSILILALWPDSNSSTDTVGIDFNEVSLWREVQNENTIEAYDRYLNAYPQGIYADKAKEERNLLISTGAARIYEELQFNRNNNNTSNEVSEMSVVEEGAWQNALQQNTRAAFENFLRQYPNSPYADEARRKIRQLPAPVVEENILPPLFVLDRAWEQAKEANTREGYQKYIRENPNGHYVNDARERIKELDERYRAIQQLLLPQGGQ